MPTVLRSAKPGARVPRSRDLVPNSRMQQVVLFLGLASWLGPPEPELPWGGDGGFRSSAEKEARPGIALASA
jgi:hypothetical protein